MADETTVAAEAAVEAPAKVVEAVVETAETLANESAKTAKRVRSSAKRQAKRNAETVKAATKTAARKTVAATQKRIETVNKKTNSYFPAFDAVPAFAPFQSLFADAGERGQELAKKTQKVTEELADLARANVEAIVEAGRVATEGARSIGQNVVAKQRDGYEQAADAIRSLAEAKSPTEYLQLQGDFARASFDRAVAESSKLTESLVKLAGETFQPLSNRATANAERFNTLVA